MMNHLMFSVYDVASRSFQRPFIATARGEAMRSFIDICADKTHPLGQHPEDYTLMEVGEFDDQSGEVNEVVNSKVITGLEAAAAGAAPDPQEARYHAYDHDDMKDEGGHDLPIGAVRE